MKVGPTIKGRIGEVQPLTPHCQNCNRSTDWPVQKCTDCMGIPLQHYDLISWEEGGMPDGEELQRIVARGYVCFRYVAWGTDMVNLLCSKTNVINELDQEDADLIGQRVFLYLTS